jgi:hypothetical protein
MVSLIGEAPGAATVPGTAHAWTLPNSVGFPNQRALGRRYSFFGRTDACRLGDADKFADRFIVD